ncbi:MAG: N-6 DNA methylase [Planctomycetes bacterium]|nr:N-6 DNA methylase [Planctomycetota bacterium]
MRHEDAMADAVASERWAAVRRWVRGVVAARLDRALADELLPATAAEAAAPPLALPPPSSFASLAAGYADLLPAAHRKQRGAWFTTPALTDPTAARTLAPLRGSGPRALAIADPAVGGGAFLLAAHRQLVAAGMRPRDAVACLHGTDSDATAATLAALALWEACGDDAPDPRTIAARVRPGDGLRDLSDGAFDAVLTNPPWETLQGDRETAARVAALRPRFHHQGRGKLYTYRLFVERAHRLLRAGGRFGLLVPASLWFDRDAEPLRRLLLDDCAWEWLYGFENTRRLFPIDGRYRFAAIVGRKGGRTEAVRVAFGGTDPAAWADPAPVHATYGRDELRALSPASGAFVEVEDARDLEVLRRLHAHGRPLLGTDGRFAWRQGDFNMTADRDAFVPRAEAEGTGYRRGADAVWRRAGAPDLLPLHQGAMLYDLHPNAGAHRAGTGHATQWEAPASLADLRPAYLVDAAAWRRGAAGRPPARIALRALSNATNERTAIACLLPDVPCGNSLGVLTPRGTPRAPLRRLAAGAAVLAALAFDWALRLRLAGTNLNRFVLEDCVVPRLDDAAEAELAVLALRLCAVLPWHGPLWALAAAEGWCDAAQPATDPGERRALATAIDVRVGRAFGLGPDAVAWIVRGCDLPRPANTHRKGFWRVDRDLPPAHRRPVRWRRAVEAGG